jgi:hypothetical protein
VARYGQAFKDKAVARLLPPESADINVVARDMGVASATLERWRANALASERKHDGWTAAARLDAVLTTASLSEEEKNAWCRAQGIFPSERWSGSRPPRTHSTARRRCRGTRRPASGITRRRADTAAVEGALCGESAAVDPAWSAAVDKYRAGSALTLSLRVMLRASADW